jgi:hypothetical protein
MSTQTENRLALQRQRAQIVKDRQRQRCAERDGKQVVRDDDDDNDDEPVQDTTDYSDQIGQLKKEHHEQFLKACAAGDWTPISTLLLSPFLYRSTIEEGRKLALDQRPRWGRHDNLIKKLDYYLEHELNILHVDKW